jgi:enediyne biosynthesis protein E4
VTKEGGVIPSAVKSLSIPALNWNYFAMRSGIRKLQPMPVAVWLAVCWISTSFLHSAPPGVRITSLEVAAGTAPGFQLLHPQETGLTFTNLLAPAASARNRVLNNGSGVAAGDYDGDGQIDLFFCSLNDGNKLFRNLGHWRFADVTATSGLRFPAGYYRGAVFTDVNGDRRLDLLVGTVGAGVLVFLNEGGGKFVDATDRAGTATSFASETMALADVDGNGTLDLYVCDNRTDDVRDWPRIPVMYVNGQPTVPPSLRNRLTFSGGRVQEYGEPDTLYLNDGTGRFTPLPWTQGAFLNEEGRALDGPPLDWGLTAAFRDVNNDGWPDLYVCNDFWTPDRFWINDGRGHFQAVGPLVLRKTSASCMGIDFADVNRDGYLDFFTVDMLSRSSELRKRQMVAPPPVPTRIGAIENRPQTARNALFLNRGDGTYAEIACLAGVAASEWSWSPVFLDVDLDGYDDLLITAGHFRDVQDLDTTERIRALQNDWRSAAQGQDQAKAFLEAKIEHTKLYPPLDAPVVAFRNQGNLHFQEMTSAWGLDLPGVSHGVAVADLDNDGDLDLAINRLGAPAAVYRNNASAGRVAVRLAGRAPNTQAIGAKIELVGGAAPHQIYEVTSGGSYVSGPDTLRVFAVKSDSAGMRLRITWRDGSVTEIEDVRPNCLYEVNEEKAWRRPRGETNPTATPEPVWFRDVSDWLHHMHHEDPFDDLSRQPLLPRKLSQSGPGAAWYDVNRDGWIDLIIGSGQGGRMAVLWNRNGRKFEAAAAPAYNRVLPCDQSTILGWRGQTGNAMLLAGYARYESGDATSACAVFYEAGNGRIKALLPGQPASVGALAMADVDNDGDLDLFVGGQVIPGRYPEAASSLLYLQTNGQWVLDHQNKETLRDVGLVQGAVWSDLDADGYPDLIAACEWGPVRVFRNDHGRLRDFTETWGLAPHTGWWTGVTTGDFDGDGRLDIVAGNWGRNSLYQASPKQPLQIYYGNFAGGEGLDIIETEFDPTRERTVPLHQRDFMQAALPYVLERFPTHAAWSRASVEDVIRDRPGPARHLSVTTLASLIFLNRGGKFERRDLPEEAQFAPVFGVAVADADGDGREDVFLAQNFFAFPHEENRLDGGRGLWLRGDGTGHFSVITGQRSGVLVYGEQRAAALADFDRDGRVDLVVTQNGAATRLFHNEAARPGLSVRLEGSKQNPDAAGAVVRLKYGQDWGPARELHAGSGYWSQDAYTVVMGLKETPKAVWVRWPGGKVSETTVAPDQREITIACP